MHKVVKKFKGSGLSFLWITLVVFIIDWGTKTLVNTYLIPYNSVSVMPFFNLTLAYNTGTAFSFLDTGSLWSNILFAVIATIVSIGILIWLLRLPRSETLMNVGLSFILGGAIGNLWDRFRYNHVIDFIDFYVSNWHFPVFNCADAAVTCGAILVMWKWIWVKK